MYVRACAYRPGEPSGLFLAPVCVWALAVRVLCAMGKGADDGNDATASSGGDRAIGTTAVRRRTAAVAEPEDATAETRRMYGDRVMATGGKGSGSSGMSTALLPPPSERGLLAKFSSPTVAMGELRVIKDQFAALKKLGYAIQGKAPKELSAEWDSLGATGNAKYEEIEASIQRFLRHTNGAARWRPNFYLYYVLPIVLNLVKLAVFCSPAGILGVLLYDVIVIMIFTVLRHPYAVGMAVSYAADHDAIPSMGKTACLYLAYEALKSAAQEHGFTIVETWDAYRLDMRPIYTVALWLYLAYTHAHQAYTLYLERSWKHRRAIDVCLSCLSHQVNNLSFVVAFCKPGPSSSSPPYLHVCARKCALAHWLAALRLQITATNGNPSRTCSTPPEAATISCMLARPSSRTSTQATGSSTSRIYTPLCISITMSDIRRPPGKRRKAVSQHTHTVPLSTHHTAPRSTLHHTTPHHTTPHRVPHHTTPHCIAATPCAACRLESRFVRTTADEWMCLAAAAAAADQA